MQGRGRGSRGQSLIEFSLAFPVVLLMLFSIVEAGMLFLAYGTVANAAREGCRYGIVHPDDWSGIEATARRLTVGLNKDALSFTISRPTPKHLQVEADYDYAWTFGALVELFGGGPTIHLHTETAMRVERE